MDIRFDILQSLNSHDSSESHLKELEIRLKEKMRSFRRIYEENDVKRLRRQFYAGKATQNDFLQFSLIEEKLLALSDEIYCLKHEIERRKDS